MLPRLRLLFCCLSLMLPLLAGAQQPAAPVKRQPRILLLVDGSSSMLSPWQQGIAGPDRFHTAARVIAAIVDSIYAINPEVEFGLRVYGHQYPAQEQNCRDSRREVSFSKDNRTQLALRMASLAPAGVSPIAWSLREAAENDLMDEAHYAYSIILITDGGESCGGDICAIARLLLEKKIFFRPYVLSLAGDPGLKMQYDCLGRFLTASNEPGVTSSIRTIIDDYRPLLRLPEIVSSPPVTVNPPAQPSNPVTVVTRPLRPRTMLLPPIDYSFATVNLPTSLQPGPRPGIQDSREVVPAAPKYTKQPQPVAVDTATRRPTDTVARRPVRPSQPVVTRVDTPARRPRPVPTRAPATVTSAPKPPASPSDLSARVQATEDKETTFAVYFTDGHGTYYHTSPELQLINKATNQTTKFVRTLDLYDEPRFQTIEAGTYTLVVPGRSGSSSRVSTVEIQANKKNKVEIIVRNGSIRFAYENNPDRPVKEYDAEIKISVTHSRTPIIMQHCDTELYFPPENYHIEVNTLPKTEVLTGVDFNSTTYIMIPEPGYLEITNRNRIGRVGLFVTRGGVQQWVRFHELEVNGNLPEQVVRMNPGSYQMRYLRTSGGPSEEVIVPFTIQSNGRTSKSLE